MCQMCKTWRLREIMNSRGVDREGRILQHTDHILDNFYLCLQRIEEKSDDTNKDIHLFIFSCMFELTKMQAFHSQMIGPPTSEVLFTYKRELDRAKKLGKQMAEECKTLIE
jgi:hypothetical protein